jgi:heme A synthase
MRMIFFAHSGLRYLVLLIGFFALVYFAYAVATKKGNERVGRILGASFAGVIDLQIVLGLIMVAMGLFYSALIGHLFMMIGAAGVAHGASVLARNSPVPDKANAIRLAGVAVALVLIAGGILAIGRSIFGSGSPTMIY